MRALLRVHRTQIGIATRGYARATRLQRSVPAAAAPGQEPPAEAVHLRIHERFYAGAAALREHFDKRFANPLEARADRFCWDFWHVENQYTLLRTPADRFFPRVQYEALEDALLEFGERQLGCRGMSPAWVACYVDGCRQELHTDAPHGPWAFVLSLTPAQRAFAGGDTLLMQPHVLNYWPSFDPSAGLEMKHLVTAVEPAFNRLIVFDPRLPHGVRAVEGTRDPRRARLVVTGWFTEPTPFFTGALAEGAAAQALGEATRPLSEELAELPPCAGTVVVRLRVSGATGGVEALEWLTDTLVPLPAAEYSAADARGEVFAAIQRRLGGARFPPCAEGDSEVTVPLVFE
ncbi:hypothetical protein WJX81_000606 [Elliptochloris bilobata]|uniref:Fe2OG dioxygenase domain-containing protein n=1 Tax=Elliptochloris bilobata TaxID=381761 RepID=A0AAW1RYP1_9CHLO